MVTPQVQALQDALNQIDTATTAAGTAVTAVQNRIQRLLDQIAGTTTPEQLQPLLDQANAEVAKLGPLAEVLNQMGQDTENPVPTPVPAP